MAEYTYENIIINPNKEGIESLIGKEVFFNSIPCLCLDAANEKSTVSLGILVGIYKDSVNPFVVERNDTTFAYPCIIEKKEEPKPEYRPFNNSYEFINRYFCLNTDNKEHLLQLLGVSAVWLKCKNDDIMCLVTEIWPDGVVLGIDRKTTSWKELLEDYVFLEGTPCGRLMENT